MKPLLILITLLSLAACAAPPDAGPLPTVAQLPSTTPEPPSATPQLASATPPASATATGGTVPSATPTVTLTAVPPTLPASPTSDPQTRAAAGGREFLFGAPTATPSSLLSGVEVTLAADVTFVEVVIAARSIAAGQVLGTDDLRLAPFPAPAVPNSALSDPDDAVGQVALINLYCGMPVVRGAVGTASPLETPVPLASMDCTLPALTAPVELVPVVVAAQAVPAGVYIPEAAAVLRPYPRLWLPPGALFGGEQAVDGRVLMALPADALILASVVGEENPNPDSEESAPEGP